MNLTTIILTQLACELNITNHHNGTLGILGLIKSHPDLMGTYFLNTWQAALTSQEVLECLEFQEDNDKETNYFLVKAIQNLENGLCRNVI